MRTEHLVVVAQEFPTETVFVTFNAMFKLAQGDSFWGDIFFEKERIAAVGVITVRPNWYPAVDMAAAAAAINARTGGRRVITYGFSQGGYGALKFGSALNASCAIAFSPQISIDPSVVGEFDRRYTAHHRPELANGVPIAPDDLCGRNYVYFDRRLAIDARHIALIGAAAEAGNVRLDPVIVPFLGHESMWIVTEGGMGPAMVRQFCSDAPPARRELRALVRGARNRSETYHRTRILWLLERAARGTRLLANAVAGLVPGSLRSFAEVCLLIATGERDRAVDRLRELTDESLLKAVPPIRAWKYFRAHGFAEGELRIARVIGLRPPEPLLRLHAVNSYIAHGLRDEASRLLDEIEKMDGVELCKDHVRTYGEQLGRR